MSIIFGNLTNTFVKFGQELTNGSQSDIESAAAAFRHSANKDATILVYIESVDPKVTLDNNNNNKKEGARAREPFPKSVQSRLIT